MTRARLTSHWRVGYTPALTVSQGEPLRVEGSDPDNPGRRWALNASGLGGWLPETLLNGTHPTQDFDGTERTATVGTPVRILTSHARWHYCQDPTGAAGWLPATHLALSRPPIFA